MFRRTNSFDVAIVLLHEDIDIYDDVIVGQVFLPWTPTPWNAEVTAPGWGVTDRGFGSSELMKAELNIIGTNHCDALLRRVRVYDVNVKATMICATNKSPNVCPGDPGGPLMMAGTNTLVGILSYSLHGCLGPYQPGVYTDAYKLRDFIKGTAEKYGDE